MVSNFNPVLHCYAFSIDTYLVTKSCLFIAHLDISTAFTIPFKGRGFFNTIFSPQLGPPAAHPPSFSQLENRTKTVQSFRAAVSNEFFGLSDTGGTDPFPQLWATPRPCITAPQLCDEGSNWSIICDTRKKGFSKCLSTIVYNKKGSRNTPPLK